MTAEATEAPAAEAAQVEGSTLATSEPAAEPSSSTVLTQDAGEASAEPGGEVAPAVIAPKAPESYADFTFAEGVQANPEVMAAFMSTAKELDLTQDGAQRVVDLGSQLVQQTQAAIEAQRNAEIAQWAEDFHAQPNSKDLLVDAQRAVKEHLSLETVTMLEQTGLGNYGPLIQDLAKLAQLTKEDQSVGGSAPESGGESLAKSLFPNYK